MPSTQYPYPANDEDEQVQTEDQDGYTVVDPNGRLNSTSEHTYPPGRHTATTPNGGYQSRERNTTDKITENVSQYQKFAVANPDEAVKVGTGFGTVAGASLGLYSAAAAATLSPAAVVGGGIALVAGGVNAGINGKQAYDKWNDKTAEEKRKKVDRSKGKSR
jgi:hypothetical protein